jgi:hypothetical protein
MRVEEKMTHNFTLIALVAQLIVSVSASAWADCQIVTSDGKKTPFDGKSLGGLQVEKKSLLILNKTYPNLNAVELVFTGEVNACTNCTEKYVTCAE